MALQSGSVSGSVQVAGLMIPISCSRSAGGTIAQTESCPKGYSGTLTTRTSDTAGEITAVGHNLVEDDYVTVYWAAGVAYCGVVGVVAGDVVPVSLLKGDVLPIKDASVIISKELVLNADFDGDDTLLIAAYCPDRAVAIFEDSGNNVLLPIKLFSGESWFWISQPAQEPPPDPPITGNPVDELHISTASVTSDQDFSLGLLYDNTP